MGRVRTRALVRGGGLHDGSLSGNVGDGDAFSGAEIRNGLQELIESRLQLRHLRARVLLETGLHRLDDLAALEVAQHVHLDPLDLVGGDGLRRLLGRVLQIETGDVDLEPELLAQAHPHQVQLFSAGADGRLRGDALALLGHQWQRVEEENSQCDRAHGSLQRPQLHTCTAGVWRNSEKMLHGAHARPHLDRR